MSNVPRRGERFQANGTPVTLKTSVHYVLLYGRIWDGVDPLYVIDAHPPNGLT